MTCATAKSARTRGVTVPAWVASASIPSAFCASPASAMDSARLTRAAVRSGCKRQRRIVFGLGLLVAFLQIECHAQIGQRSRVLRIGGHRRAEIGFRALQIVAQLILPTPRRAGRNPGCAANAWR
ncbi:MAG: hypothetical protein WDN04_06215 [Rhodospirillales bacterium]